MAGGNNDAVVTAEPLDTKPKGLLHTLSLIEQFSVAERDGEIPTEVLTTQALALFMLKGFEMSLIGVITTAVLSPIMFAVQEGIIPVFGAYGLTLFDKIFIFILTTSFTFGSSILICMMLGRLYCGNITKKTIHALVSGIVVGSLFISFLVMILMHILFFKYLTPEGVVYLVGQLPSTLRPSYRFVYWVFQFLDQMIPSSYFQAAVNIASSLVIVSAIFVGKRRSRKLDKLKKEWL